MKNQERVTPPGPVVSRHDETADVCELIVAELKGRRERLRELLRMVAIEVKRQAQAQPPKSTRSRCKRSAIKN